MCQLPQIVVDMPENSFFKENNPLLAENGFPQFDKIKIDQIEPTINFLIRECEKELSLLEKINIPTWDTLMTPLEMISERFHRATGPIVHLKRVNDSKELRDAWEKIEPTIISFSLRLKQSKSIYENMKKLLAKGGLSEVQQRILNKNIIFAELAGIALSPENREKFAELQKKLARLQSEFEQNLLDSTKSFSLIITDKADLEGLSSNFLALTSQMYNAISEEKNSTPEKGPWRISLEAPIFIPVLQHCKSRDVRKKLYLAYLTRSSSGKSDNSQKIREILKKRKELANLLGFNNFGELSLKTKMAGQVQTVNDLLEQLRLASWDAGKKQFNTVKDFASKHGEEDLKHWDISFWSERLKESLFNFKEEELTPYFQLPKVLKGLFALCNKLFDINIKDATGTVSTWNKDVKFFIVEDSNKNQIASFYFDPYSRPENKLGGAWEEECVTRMRKNGKIQLPTAYIVCNFPNPIGDKQSCLKFSDVTTLFHEFGHALQNMLTKVDYAEASGVNGIEWDAVELASQFMENWCYHKPTLLGISSHIDTHKPLPDELFAKILASKNFLSALGMLTQVRYASVDMDLHTVFDVDGVNPPNDIVKNVTEKTSFLPYLPEERFLCSFHHIFSGDYAAGYYSYKWAEVLSADAFKAFEDVGLDNSEAVSLTGKRFRDTILSMGGGTHPLIVFKKFRGREPTVDALLEHSGLKIVKVTK